MNETKKKKERETRNLQVIVIQLFVVHFSNNQIIDIDKFQTGDIVKNLRFYIADETIRHSQRCSCN